MLAAEYAEKDSPYQFKPGPWSSHSLLMAALPQAGDGRRVLDVGCGPGYLGALLAARGYRVTGIESPGRAGEDFPAGVELIEADLDCGLPPLGARYDFILCADVLEHLRAPGALLEALRGLLAPSGRLVASLPNSGHAFFRWTVLRGRFPAEDRGLFDRTHLHFYTWSGWRELFAGAGFRFESVQPTGVPVGLALPRWEDTFLVRMLESLSYMSARVWKTMFAYQFVVKARP
jgi:SAM-dependent methyltransferase